MATLTTAQKIKALEESDFILMWDGCHKIYFLTEEEKPQGKELGYDEEDFFPATELRQLILDSCGLVFVSVHGYNTGNFEHVWNIEQCTEDIYSAAEEES